MAKNPPNRGFSSTMSGGRLLEPILTQTAHFLVPLRRLKSLNHHPQWRVGNFGENYHAETIHYTRCGQKPCALTTRRSRSVRSRLVAGRCNEQLGKKHAAHRIRVGGHNARCNLGLLRNALADWSALTRHRTAGSAWRRTLQMRSWLRRHDKTDGPANEPNQRPDQNRNSYPGDVRPMGQHTS